VKSGSLVALLGGVRAGVLTRDSGHVSFRYDPAYLNRLGATPLSVSMPLRADAHCGTTVATWLAGLLPDDERVLARWSRRFQVGSNAFSLLSSPVGEDCAGAVQFCSEERTEQLLAHAGYVDWLDEAGVGAVLRELKEDRTAWLGRDFGGQFSLGGAQAKRALLLEDGRFGVPHGAIPTTHVLKPAIAGLDDHDLNEHLCLSAARILGLPAAASRVATFDGEQALVVERYDRVRREGQWVRVHQEDLCQALGIDPAAKYQNEGGPGAAQIVQLFRRVLPPRPLEDATARFLDALAFNWLVAGLDAHAKNYSLLMSGNQIRLAPLYDLASALPYPEPSAHKHKLAMKLGGTYLLAQMDGRTWPAVATDLGLSAEVVATRALHLTTRIADAFATAADDPAVASLRRPLVTALVDGVAARAAGCAALLSA